MDNVSIINYGFGAFLPAATKLWPRLCFYTCVWFCSRGGSLGRETPPPPEAGRENPPGGQREPPWAGRPSPSRENPPGKEKPPTPTRENPPAYGQWTAGTHPTGMHSCYLLLMYFQSTESILRVCVIFESAAIFS